MNGTQLEEFGVMVGGQGGDGSLTLVNLVGDLFAARGYHLYHSRNVASRIKGGTATASLRASLASHGCLGDRIDLLVAFDVQALAQAGPWLDARSQVIFDSSDGPVAKDDLPAGANVLEVPLARLAVRDMRRDLYKNSLAFGVAARLVGAVDAVAEATLRNSLAELPAPIVEANVGALHKGFAYADEAGIIQGHGSWTIGSGSAHDLISITGNEATAFGFLVAGGRFFAGYPITPATEILEWLTARLPEFGGIAIQVEDELSAINMALGAAMTGTRAMTASSGPGIALMQEGIGHLGSAEIGLVVVDCQRAGPSTGMPTKPEQSDIGMLVYGANGDIPRVVLAPGDPGDAFELTVLATNLAERYQGPVYIALDQAVAQDAATVPRFDLDSVTVDRGNMLGAEEVSALHEYRRYALTGRGDGISPWVPAGTPGGQHLVTGNEHDEWGLVSTLPANRVRMVEKRARKLEAIRPSLPRARAFGDPGADIALIGFGLDTGVMREAVARLAERGLPVRGLQVRTLWPVLEDLKEAISECRYAYLVEHNAGGQYAHVLASQGIPPARLRSVLRYDGLPFRPAELVHEIVRRETA